MASKQWIDYKKTLGRQLTDNVKANEALSPFYFVLILLIYNYHLHIPYWSGKLQTSGVFFGLMSTFIYVFCSNYFQPDLDLHRNRPGMGHFPFGRWVGAYKYGRFLKWVAWPINRTWYWLWHPYGQLLTHRGVGHWPLIGVWLRIGYLWVIVHGLNLIIPGNYLGLAEQILEMFFPFNHNFGSMAWFLICFPVFISDIIHIAVDYRDSVRKGISFCPPPIPRGMIMKVFNTLRDIKNKKI